jgi:hypothetical protein
MTNKYVGAAKFFANLITGGGKKTTGTEVITSLPIAKNLKKRFDTKQDIIKSVDQKANPNVSNQKKSEIKLDASKKVSKIYDTYEKKAKGGRVGLKRGTGLMSRKSNIQKIKETFGPRQSQAKNLKTVDKKKNPGLAKLPMEVRNKMGYAAKGGRAMLKKGSKFPDLNKDGKITKADILMGRGVIKKKTKKKVI